MNKKLYVGNISFNATEDDVRGLFAKHGGVESVNIVKDEQGRTRGFGFVQMTSEEDAQQAVSSLNGKAFMERTLVVAEARQEQPRDRGGFNRGGGAGGRRSGPGSGGRGRGRGWR